MKRVLAGVDFSEASKQALERAGSWATRLGVPLVAMHVLQSPAPMLPEAQIALPDPAWLHAMEDHAREQLENWVSPYPGATALVKWGGPAEELVSEADPDTLLVVAQVGHSTLERLLFGSTAARVVRLAPCDVLVVRTEQAK
ncbi:universal stress protein [Geothrix sp. PMB-07]|uniref:universal stress protein n=1 Tax=Geothrix sp. PMB-07 TaxID=3068640 RepID=UPI00274268F9|nr:universal stress protein [Geothrix sp. PMB-07]WLT33567.1 universal stress protein [Geothrix sp. PMB-07]